MAEDVDRIVRVPRAALDRAVWGPYLGRSLMVPVAVDWPELRLTEAQMLANAAATAAGAPAPFPDRSIFWLELEYPAHVRTGGHADE